MTPSSQRRAVTLAPDTHAALDACARAAGLTLNTCLVAAWALVLASPGASEVLFGTTVSGRPVTYPDIESIVGVFINTLPFRVRLAGELPVREWLRTLQAHQHAMLEHQSIPLAELNALASASRERPLFESILVCQNALGQFAGRTMGDITIAQVSSTGHPHYPLMCRVTPQRPLLVEIVFDIRRVGPALADVYLARMCDALDRLPRVMDRRLDDFTRELTAPARNLAGIRPKPAASLRGSSSTAT